MRQGITLFGLTTAACVLGKEVVYELVDSLVRDLEAGGVEVLILQILGKEFDHRLPIITCRLCRSSVSRVLIKIEKVSRCHLVPE
jgi:hypothetical protein